MVTDGTTVSCTRAKDGSPTPFKTFIGNSFPKASGHQFRNPWTVVSLEAQGQGMIEGVNEEVRSPPVENERRLDLQYTQPVTCRLDDNTEFE